MQAALTTAGEFAGETFVLAAGAWSPPAAEAPADVPVAADAAVRGPGQALLAACAALGSTPARTLMVGDSSNDAQAARAAGCPVVLVTYGYNHGEPVTSAGADGIVDSLALLH